MPDHKPPTGRGWEATRRDRSPPYMTRFGVLIIDRMRKDACHECTGSCMMRTHGEDDVA